MIPKPETIVVLAHLMERDGTLGAESRARADLAVELAQRNDCGLLFMGWAYRPDTTQCISDAMAAYVTNRHAFPASKLMIDRQSRDTVGDAVFSKRMLGPVAHRRVVRVVTSDYHAARTGKVFSFVYGGDWNLSVDGAQVESSIDALAHEARSIEAFTSTFEGVTPGDERAIVSRLASRHPFYNGDVYEKINVA